MLTKMLIHRAKVKCKLLLLIDYLKILNKISNISMHLLKNNRYRRKISPNKSYQI